MAGTRWWKSSGTAFRKLRGTRSRKFDNNAVESYQSEGLVAIRIYEVSSCFVIVIQDFGRGISKDHLDQIGIKGFTFGKESGSGLGLNHALSTVISFAGSLDIDSRINQGTVVTIKVPKAQ